MKKINLLIILALTGLFFTSCEETNYVTTVATFEDVTLTDSVWNGSDASGKFVSKSITFNNSYTVTQWGASWSGFACSSKKDKVTTGWNNQYSAITGVGASNSKQYAVAFDSASVVCPADKLYGAYYAKSLMVTNSTYAYFDMTNGSGFSKKFAAGDWFKVVITGYLNNKVVGKKEFYLADFREGKSVLVKNWEKVDISSLGEVDRLSFTFGSSDTGSFGINTPKYVCIDDLELQQEEITE